MMKLSFAGATIGEINGSILAYAATLGAVSANVGNPPAAPAPAPLATGDPAAPIPAAAAATAPVAPASTSADVDAAGVVWDAAKHAGTKAKVASGLWRMKVGVTRPESEGEKSPNYVKPGSAATSNAGPTSSPGTPPAPPAPPAPPIDPNRPTDPTFCHDNGNGTEQWFVNGAWDAGQHPIPAPAAPVVEDEFAQFAAAAGATAAAPVARTWTDADLALLGNQAAQKVGAPEPIKAVIAKYATPGGIGHSREIPAEQREAYARELETTFGFQYAAA